MALLKGEVSRSNPFPLAQTMAMVALCSFLIFLASFHGPVPVRYNWRVFARKMHSTSEFAMIVLSKCVCLCARVCVCAYVYAHVH